MIWYCGCGCGNFASFGKRYICGHNIRVNYPMQRLDVIEKKRFSMLGNKNHAKRDDVRKKISIGLLRVSSKQKERMLNGLASYANSFVKNPSKPQVKLFEMTKLLCHCAVLNFPVEEINRNIDIAIPLHKIAIEYDGSYWHQDEEKDAKRQEQLELLGWKFIRYRDYIPSLDELKKSIMEVHI